MKSILSLIFVFLGVSATVSAESAYEKQVAFEGKITDQLVHKLDKVLAKDSYKVIVNGNLKVERRRIKIEEQVDQSAKGLREKNKSTAQALPGFNVKKADQDGGGSNDLSKSSVTKYKYVENLQVDSLDVYLIYGESLPEDRKVLATSIVEKHLKSTFGNKANIIASAAEVDAPAGTLTERLAAWMASYLNLRGGTAIDLLYLILVGIVLLAAILGIWGYFWRKRRSAMNHAQSASANSEAAGKLQEDLELARAEAKEAIGFVIDALTKNTLVTQSFLRQLKYADKTTLISYIHSPALNEYMMRVLGIEATFREDLTKLQQKHSRERTEKLKTIVEDLKHYQKLQDDFNTHRFGYLNLIEPKVLFNYFSSGNDMIEKLALAARYLPKLVYLSITSQLNTEQKANLYSRLSGDRPSDALLDRMEEELRVLFEKQKREISCPTEGPQLQHLMLDNDLSADELIVEMKKQGHLISDDLKKYSVNIDNIFSQNENVIRRVIDELSNEVIAKAYAKSPLKYKLKDFMPENRFRLIDAMIARYHRIDEEQIKEAQLQILGAYRINV